MARRIPLVGVALEVMKKLSDGFPSYKENESNFSSAAGKYFRENKLFPAKKHVSYSLRHTFENRMEEAIVDEELRSVLMGHTIDRPKYGSGGSLNLHQEEGYEMPRLLNVGWWHDKHATARLKLVI